VIFILGIIVGLLIAILNVILYTKKELVTKAVDKITGKSMASVVDMSDPVGDLYKIQ
jgi:hypothetical protein